MPFASSAFLLVFLPAVLAGYLLVSSRWGLRVATLWLLAASVVFYARLGPLQIGLLGFSIGANFLVARHLRLTQKSRHWLITGIAGNVIILGIFKYTGFIASNVTAFVGAPMVLNILLPVGISFYTFQQIAYLAHVHRNPEGAESFLDYALFITFFPQLIAGPILYREDFFSQLKSRPHTGTLCNLAVGGTIFIIGLAKKMLLADILAQGASPVFDLASQGQPVAPWLAWFATLCYTFQIYFDFSGYSDMAVGLGRLFGFKLPMNFASPYKAHSPIDFWQRWHITLSRFLRDFIYIALGGNRCGRFRKLCNVFATMLVAGLWHGAGWTFLLWGAMHGVLVASAHVFYDITGRDRAKGGLFSITLTFVLVALAWVPFRAASLPAAWTMYGALFGVSTTPAAAAGRELFFAPAMPLLFLAAGICFLSPNLMQFMGAHDPVVALRGYAYTDVAPQRTGIKNWYPATVSACCLAVLFWLCVNLSFTPSTFIYFKF